jgi:hypothetical protein
VKDFSFSGEHRKESAYLRFPPNPINMEEIMSVNFDPTYPLSNAGRPIPTWNCSEKLSYLIRDGIQKERLPPIEYCKKAWTQQTGSSPDKISAEFLKACTSEWRAYIAYVNFSRLN